MFPNFYNPYQQFGQMQQPQIDPSAFSSPMPMQTLQNTNLQTPQVQQPQKQQGGMFGGGFNPMMGLMGPGLSQLSHGQFPWALSGLIPMGLHALKVF